MERKNVILAGVCMSVLSFALTGCGNTQEAMVPEGNSPTEKIVAAAAMEKMTPGYVKDAGDEVTLDWYINFSWFNTSWGESVVSKAITEKTGVNVRFTAPTGNEAEKLNAMIISENLPDLITLDYHEYQSGELIDKDLVWAMDELADKYDCYWYQTADQDAVNWYTREDGHIYGYPNYSCSKQDYDTYDNIASNQTFLVRKDIYEAIGSPDMTTPEGFEAAVKAAVEKYPLINGEPLIPIGACEFTETGNNSFDSYLCNFLAIPYEKNGKYYDRYSDPELIRWLKEFRKLGEEGYLASDIFTDKRTLMEEKIAKGRYFCMLFQRTDLSTQELYLYSQNPDSVYIAVDGPKNSEGGDYELPGNDINGWTLTFISKSCEHPDRAIELISYLLSEEGQEMIWLGVEGETWDYVDGVMTMHEDVYQLMGENRVEFDRIYGADATYWMLMDNIGEIKYKPPLAEPLLQMKEWTYPYLYNASAYNVTLPTDSTEAKMELEIKRQWGKILPELLLAPSEEEFDQIFSEYMQYKKVKGMDQILNQKTELMNKAKEKLGEE